MTTSSVLLKTHHQTMNKCIPHPLAPLIAFLLVIFTSCSTQDAMSSPKATTPNVPEGHEFIDLGAGCFWCVEAVYQRIDGITSVTSGYMGGKTKNPTYEDICRGDTNHAEIVRVVFDPKKIELKSVLEWFWKLHDPTTLNRQGGDRGTQYRSVIFYQNEEQKKVADASKATANPAFDNKIVTEISKASTFYPAEVEHQDYYRINGNKNPYCNAIIPPKLKKLNLLNKEEKKDE